MPVTLTERQAAAIAAAQRRGAIDSFRIADAIDPAGKKHFLIEVSDMGQFAKDWEQLKTLIRQKDDAIDKQAAQIAQLQKQIAGQSLDADDLKALADAHQTVVQNAPAAPAPAAAKPATPPPAHTAAVQPGQPVTTFVK